MMPTTAIISYAGSLNVSVVDRDGKPAANAVVMVYPSASATLNQATQAPPSSLTLSQASMQFSPTVALVQVGAKVTFVNNDPWDHHVRGSAAGVKEFSSNTTDGFSFRLAGKTSSGSGKINSSTVTFDKAGVTLLACYLHGSMTGHVVVSDTSWAAKTDADGVATFSNMPDGAAQIKTWHPAQFVDISPATHTIKPGANQVKMHLNVVIKPQRRAIQANEYQ